MGRADTHLAACAITAALLLAVANAAVAAADTPDSTGTSSNASESSKDPAPSGRTVDSKTTDENTNAAESQPTESFQTNIVAAPAPAPDEHTEEATQKKPVDKESCADNHHAKTIDPPVVEAPSPVERAPLPQAVAPALEAPPPLDLPPSVPSSPVDPDTVDATTGQSTGNHPHGHELPVLTMPFLAVSSMPTHILGASIAPRVSLRGDVVTSAPPRIAQPSTALLRASPSEPLPEPPTTTGLTARGQTPKDTTYGYASRSLAGMAAGAMPGVAGMVIMTAGGVCLGYRQAKAHLTLIESAERFLY